MMRSLVMVVLWFSACIEGFHLPALASLANPRLLNADSARGVTVRSKKIQGCKMSKDGDGSVKYSDLLVSTLGSFLPGGSGVGKSSTSTPSILDAVDWQASKVRGLDAAAMAARLDAGLQERQWFVTGNILPELFSDDFEFKDPNVSLKGVEDYARGVNKLFDQDKSSMQVLSTALYEDEDDKHTNTITVTWRLEGVVNVGPGLEIKPYIVYTDFTLNKEGLVATQEDRFSIPGWEILIWALFPLLRPFLSAPAPKTAD